MTSRLVLTYLDHSLEKSTVQFRGVSLAAANFDAQVTLAGNLETAVAALTNGTLHKRTRVASEAVIATGAPAAGVQREAKYMVTYRDNVTGKKYRLEIPCADLSILEEGTDRVSHTHAAWTGFQTAFEAYVLSEAGNAVVLEEIIHVGRNL